MFPRCGLDLAETESLCPQSWSFRTPVDTLFLGMASSLQSAANDDLIGPSCPDAPLASAATQTGWLTEIARTDMERLQLCYRMGGNRQAL